MGEEQGCEKYLGIVSPFPFVKFILSEANVLEGQFPSLYGSG